MAKRDFLELTDLAPDELDRLLELAMELKQDPSRGRGRLAHRSLALIFRKSSTRTRVSFDVGMAQLGGHVVTITDRDSQIGRGEPIADTARVLSGYVDGIMIRTFGQDEVEEFAKWSKVPVINGLTDRVHPCQLLADLQTMREEFGPDLSGQRVAWIGDGNNMANSWLNAAHLMGFELRLACPEGYDPDPEILERARASTSIVLTRDVREAMEGATVVTTDVWASMGQEAEAARRREAFDGFMVDGALMKRADPSAIFLHCLPVHRGEEVDEAVFEGPASRVFQEAENRLHAQKALLLFLLADDHRPSYR